MASWRDDTSQLPQDDLDGLLGVVLPFGQKLLEKHGEFFPFAAAITTTGEIELIAGFPDLEDEQPRSQDVISACMDGLANRRDEVRAWALVTDVRLAETSGDAIAIDSEHAEGQAIRAILPYQMKRKLFRRRPQYGPLEAGPGQRRIWPRD
jgi:hypothetical protein